MKYILLSKDGDFLPLLYRMQEDGEEVIAYVDEVDDIHKGLTPLADDALEIEVAPDDVIIFDMVGAGKAADQLKKRGNTVIGGGSFNDKIELDRKFGTDFMQKHDIQTPPTWEFNSMDEVRNHVEKNAERYVFKPNGNLETDLTYVSSSSEDLLAVLPWIESRIPEGTEFELQQFVEGVEMSTEAWFNGDKFLLPINSTMEEKKFMAGNVGPATGCMGNVVWVWDDETSEFLYEYLFKPLEPELRKHNYLGPLDINGIWTTDGIYGLEWTSRFGYDAIQAFSRVLSRPIQQVLKELPTLDRLPVNSGVLGVGVRVSIPPFPSEGEVPNVPILGADDTEHLYFADVKIDDNLGLVCAGTDGYVLSVCAEAKSHKKALATAYEVIDNLEIPNKQYRIDIGERYSNDRAEIERIISRLKSVKSVKSGEKSA